MTKNVFYNCTNCVPGDLSPWHEFSYFNKHYARKKLQWILFGITPKTKHLQMQSIGARQYSEKLWILSTQQVPPSPNTVPARNFTLHPQLVCIPCSIWPHEPAFFLLDLQHRRAKLADSCSACDLGFEWSVGWLSVTWMTNWNKHALCRTPRVGLLPDKF